MNKNQINNPHRIYPGQILSLHRDGDRAFLTVLEAGQTASEGGMPTVRLSPRVRAEDIDTKAIPVLPPQAVIPFMQHGMIVTPEQFKNSPRIVAESEGRLLSRIGDKVYALGGDLATDPQNFYYVYTDPTPVKDPKTKAVLGYEAIYLGKLKFYRNGATVPGQKEIASTLVVTDAKREIRVGDHLSPANSEQDLLTDFVPSSAPATAYGIIAQLYGQAAFQNGSLYNVILLNQGSADGLERGNVVALWRPGREFKDTTTSGSTVGATAKTPDERYGLAMVFKIYDHLSYALVMQTENTVQVGDIFTAP